MVVPLYKLLCLLKRTQMLLLCLGIAYLMAGSLLLLQRSTIVRVAQPNLSSLPPSLSLAAPPAALGTAGLGIRTRPRWVAVQAVSGGGGRGGRHWPSSRHLGVQHFHRRWFHSLLPESPEQRAPLHRNSRHKVRNIYHRGCFKLTKNTIGTFPVHSFQPNLTTQSCIETCTDKVGFTAQKLSSLIIKLLPPAAPQTWTETDSESCLLSYKMT